MQAITWKEIEPERLNEKITRQIINGTHVTVARFTLSRGAVLARHSHVNEQITMVMDGRMKLIFDDGEAVLRSGQVMVIPPNVPHALEVLEDTIAIDYFTPPREDWIRK